MPLFSKTKPKWQELIRDGWFIPNKDERPCKSIIWLEEYAKTDSSYIKVRIDDVDWKQQKRNPLKLSCSIPVAIKKFDIFTKEHHQKITGFSKKNAPSAEYLIAIARTLDKNDESGIFEKFIRFDQLNESSKSR